ncbi:MAG: prepilin-type N-terminal cleavage/methylation domain-containing protein [Patescibacteria group bacterium]|nr:prepilin-type N-terminal cleavage/methylation domain-containing protein [Patescibacteria group bacterium]
MNKGFTLIEVIAAILIILIGLLGVFSATQKIVSYIAFSNSKLTASYLAQEGLELVRNIRDNNWLSNGVPAPAWDDGLNSCSAGCEIDYDDGNLVAYGAGTFLKIENGSGLYGYDIGSPTKFKRKITIKAIDNDVPLNGNDILEITVLVEWSERGEYHSITARGNLYDWR